MLPGQEKAKEHLRKYKFEMVHQTEQLQKALTEQSLESKATEPNSSSLTKDEDICELSDSSGSETNLNEDTREQPGPSIKRSYSNTLLKTNVETAGYNNALAIAKKRKRFHILKQLVDEDDNNQPEREPDFFTHPSVLKANSVFMRAYECPLTLINYIHFMKLNFYEDYTKDDSFLKVSVHELPEFIQIIKDQLQEIENVFGTRNPLPRIEASKYGKITDPTSLQYWNERHTDLTKSARIGLRPVQDTQGAFAIHFWMPRKQMITYSTWIGRTMLLPLPTAAKFLANLMKFEEDENAKQLQQPNTKRHVNFLKHLSE